MCPFLSGSMIDKVIMIVKGLEWFFWLWIIFGVVHIVNPRGCYEAMIRFFNWLIKLHAFDGGIVATDKSFKRFRADTLILLVLNVCVIVVIRFL